jgi:hypothetical protein
MDLDRTFAIVLVVLSVIPAFIAFTRGRRAGHGPLRLAVDTVQGGWFFVLVLSVLLPAHGVARWVAYVAGMALLVRGLWIDVRDWRRSRSAAE